MSLPFYIWKQLLNAITLFRVLCPNSNAHIVTVFPMCPLNYPSNLTMLGVIYSAVVYYSFEHCLNIE